MGGDSPNRVDSGKEMTVARRGGWTWRITDPSLLSPWADNIPAAIELGLVKSNYERDVFRTTTATGIQLFVKISRPDSVARKIKEALAPRMKSEFDALKLAGALGIPTVTPLGWGKKDASSALVTEALENAETAGAWWFSNAAGDKEFRQRFLADFADFLKKLLQAKIKHPDLHHGNILARREGDEFSFFLVDPYGLEKAPRHSKNDEMAILSALGAFRGEISDMEAVEALEMATEQDGDATALWEDILKGEARIAETLWRKRKKDFLRGARGSLACEAGLRIVLDPAGQPLVDQEELDAEIAEGHVSVETLPRGDAERRVLDSFRSRTHRLPGDGVVAWRFKSDGSADIFVELSPESPLSREDAARRTLIAEENGYKQDGRD